MSEVDFYPNEKWKKRQRRFERVFLFLMGMVAGIVVFMGLHPQGRAAAEPLPMPASAHFPNIEQLDSTTWVKHDDKRGVTCYVYYYRDVNESAGGISCLPDSALTTFGE